MSKVEKKSSDIKQKRQNQQLEMERKIEQKYSQSNKRKYQKQYSDPKYYSKCKYCSKPTQGVVNGMCKDCVQRGGSQNIKKILIDEIAAQIKLCVIDIKPQVHLPQPQVNLPQPEVNLPQPEVEIQKDKLLQKKDHHSEQEASGKDLRKLGMDSYIIESKKTRKGLYVHDGINIGAICMNENCTEFKQIVYFTLTIKQAWNIPRIIEQTYCPACKINIGADIKTIAYFNCSWKIIGKIKGQPSSFKIEQKTQKNEVSQYLPNQKAPQVQFAYLILEAQPL